jgi:hypothetical protein
MAEGIPSRGVLLYYGHLPVKETGAEVPTKGLRPIRDLPKKEELRTAAELPGELKKAAGGVFKAWKDRKRGS